MSENKVTVLSPYAAAKQVNVLLEAEGLKAIPPQMMYNYTTARVAAGKEPFIKWDAKKGVDQTSLTEWAEAYVAKRIAKEALKAVEVEEADEDTNETVEA